MNEYMSKIRKTKGKIKIEVKKCNKSEREMNFFPEK